MKRRINAFGQIRLFVEIHWVKLLIGGILVGAILWPIITLMNIDSYQRTYLVALFSMTPIQSIVYGGFFVAMLWWLHYGGGSFSKITKNRC